MEKLMKLPMNIQFFADEPEDNGGNEKNSNEEEKQNDNPEEDNGGDLPKSHSELDALINKSNQKAIENARKGLHTQEDVQAEIQKALKKEKEYADLSEEERERREWEEERNRFLKEKENFEREKLETSITADLVKKGLPASIEIDGDEYNFPSLFAQNNDPEQALKAVGAFEKAFKSAIAAQVKEEMKQPSPGTSASGTQTQNYGAKIGKKVGKQNEPVFDK